MTNEQQPLSERAQAACIDFVDGYFSGERVWTVLGQSDSSYEISLLLAEFVRSHERLGEIERLDRVHYLINQPECGNVATAHFLYDEVMRRLESGVEESPIQEA